ncbi:hypothetical protein GCK72_020632 [Caenorhabditis remanei]|uniref:DUF281 domain-containing protein n=1 Tax=Caenorhabditis remanei TaxID=31234 RepID=A0A6A5GH33_CAERE|nr:hypothetical protein GCK72_020632 [Caenorhabditis remanei]KAF1754074.1 hypothetical protein GCK72_020632 [Caenorhabditis remanei]
MIPPEDVYISTTAHILPVSTPITTTRTSTTSSSPGQAPEIATTSIPSVGNSVTPTPATPSTAASVTTPATTMMTTTSAEVCDKCDVNKIAPDLEDPVNTYFTFDVDKPATGCQMVFQVHCMRSDTMICENINIFGTNPTGNRGIATGVTLNSVSSTLTCEADGSWSARDGDVTMISKIVCTFQGCVQP